MAFKTSSERMGQTINNALHHWQKKQWEDTSSITPQPPPVDCTIAISRQAGARAPAIARLVAEKLGWPVYDRELLQKIADDHQLRLKLVESVDERHVGWLRQCMENFSSRTSISEEAYVKYLVEALYSLATMGHCIVVGRGATQVLPADRTYRVRLIGPRKDRINAIRDRFGLSEPEAAKWVERTDSERARFVRDHFQTDPADPQNYDLIINTARTPDEDAAALIIAGFHQFEEKQKAQNYSSGKYQMQTVT